MTRGQIAIITKTHILTSIEFNGDMYLPTRKWCGHGQRAINALKRVNDVADYHYEVAKFNKENHHYNDIEERLVYKMDLSTLDFTKDYFDNWFSDYIYLKNISDNSVTINTSVRDDAGRSIGTKEVELKPSAIVVLCFGRLVRLIEQ